MTTTFRQVMNRITGPTLAAAVPLGARYALEAPGALADIDTPGLFQKSDGTVWIRDADGNEAEVGGGGSQSGSLVTRAWTFTFDTPDLASGVPFYSMAENETLHQAWFEVVEAWDGTTPLGDIGFAGFKPTGLAGFWKYAFGVSVDMTEAATIGPIESGIGDVAVVQGADALLGIDAVGEAFDMLKVPAINGNHAQQNLVRTAVTQASPVTPMRQNGADELVVCVSQNGGTDGDDPGSSVGAATLYIITASPVTPTAL